MTTEAPKAAAPKALTQSTTAWNKVREEVRALAGGRGIGDLLAAVDAFGVACAAQEAELMQRQMDAVRLDAERYNWLRDSSPAQWENPIVVSQDRTARGMRYVGPLCGKSLDAAIDAAIAQPKEPTP